MIFRKVYRVTTFVPPDRVDGPLDGIVREVPLEYGRYDCSAWWSAVGVEQFRPATAKSDVPSAFRRCASSS
jgi:hypothetical protein